MAYASDSTPAPELHPAPGPVTRAIRAMRAEPVDTVTLVRTALDEHFLSMGIAVDWEAEIPPMSVGQRLAIHAAERARVHALRRSLAMLIRSDLALIDALAPEIDPDAIHDAEPIILAGDLARRLRMEERA